MKRSTECLTGEHHWHSVPELSGALFTVPSSLAQPLVSQVYLLCPLVSYLLTRCYRRPFVSGSMSSASISLLSGYVRLHDMLVMITIRLLVCPDCFFCSLKPRDTAKPRSLPASIVT